MAVIMNCSKPDHGNLPAELWAALGSSAWGDAIAWKGVSSSLGNHPPGKYEGVRGLFLCQIAFELFGVKSCTDTPC